MKPNIRAILVRAIEDGLRDGYRRAHKHVETPTESGMREAMEDAIWLHLDTYFTFDND